MTNSRLLKIGNALPYLDVVMAGYNGYDNYTNRYANVADPLARVRFTAERTSLTTAAGIGVGTLVGAGLLFALCPFTAGGGCAAAIVVVATAGGGVVGYLAEQEVGRFYDDHRTIP